MRLLPLVQRYGWLLALLFLVLPSSGCTTAISIIVATHTETTTIDITEVRAQRIEKGWRVEIDWEDGEGSELEWTPMAVLDEGPVQRTGPLVVPRRGWLDHDPARNGLWHDDEKLYLFQNGRRVATHKIERTAPLSEGVRYTALAAGLPFAIALDLATLPLQFLVGGTALVVLLTRDDDEDP